MRQQPKTIPLRLPLSVKAEVERIARLDGTSMNQFIATAVAEKLAAMTTEAYFAKRRQKADFKGFDLIMARKGGVLPESDDRL